MKFKYKKNGLKRNLTITKNRQAMRNINNDNIQNGSPLGRFREEIIDLEEYKKGKDHVHNLEGLKGNWNWNNNHWEEKM